MKVPCKHWLSKETASKLSSKFCQKKVSKLLANRTPFYHFISYCKFRFQVNQQFHGDVLQPEELSHQQTCKFGYHVGSISL